MPLLRALLSITALATIGTYQAHPQVHREFMQTSAAEFLAGTFQHTIVTDTLGGEVRLQHPLYKSRFDSLSSGSGTRYISLDGAGNFIRAWQVHDSIVVRRFDAVGNPLGPQIRVDDPGNGLIYNEGYPLALMDNGYYYVGWIKADSGRVYGQLFGPGDVKIGTNRLITESRAMDVFANAIDTTFWIITVDRSGTEPDTTTILAWRIDLSGELVEQEPKRLHQRIEPEGILDATARMSRSGDFMLGWIATGGIIGGVEETLFVQRFDNDGVGLQQPRIVNDFRGWGISWPCLAFDDSGRYIAVWSDNRNDQPGHYDFDVYAQLYNADDSPVRANFRVNAPLGPTNTEERWTDVHYRNGGYNISWASWNPVAYRYDLYSNVWSYFFGSSGEYTSPVYDAGPLINDYDSLFRTAVLPAGTSVSFRFRSGNSPQSIDTAAWYGPGHTPDSLYTTAGGPVGPGHSFNRFVQYRAYLETSEWGVTPVLRDVRLTYEIDSVAPPAPPTALALQPAHGRISLNWQSSPSTGITHHRIYRGTASHTYDATWTRTVPVATTEYTDTTVVVGVTYYYALTAVDSNLQESAYSNEVSGHSDIITLYVSADASDGGDGTFELPYRTIQEATAQALDHDTVFVLPGSYAGMVSIPPRVSLIGSGAPYTTISASGDSNVIRCGYRSMLRGFTLRMTGAVSQWCAVWCGNSGATIEENVIVNMVPESNPVDYQGIFANGGLPAIRRNYIVDFESGIDISDGVTAVITNNIVVSRLVGIQLFNDATATITNNTVSIINEYGSGIWAFPNPSAVVRNNIIAGTSTTTGMAFNTSCYLPLVSLSVEYNDAWNFLTTYECVNPGTVSISVDPLFVNTAAGDYRLQGGSPCRNAGDPGAPYLDADGSRNDLGAFGGPDPINPGMFTGFDVMFGIGSTSGFPGDTVRVEVFIDNAARLAAAGFTLGFDPSFVSLLSVMRTASTDSMLLDVDTGAGGAISVNLAGPALQGGGSVELLRMEFRIDPSAVSDQASPLSLTGVSLRDEDEAEIVLRDLQHGTIVVSPGMDGGRYVFVDRRSGSATEDGTRIHPWKTIGGGVALAVPGDTVLVAAGIYEETISIPDSIHIRGSGATITTLRADSASTILLEPAIRFSSSHGSSITRMSLTDGVTEIGLSSGPIDCQSSSIEISNCLITSLRPPVTALLQIWRKSRASIHDNVFSGGLGPAALIELFDTSYADIYRNDFGQTDRAVAFNQSRGSIGNNRFNTAGSGEGQIVINTGFPITVHNNLLESMNNNGILTFQADSADIRNNTIVGGFTGIEIRNSALRVINNIVTGNHFGIILDGGPPTSHNDSWGNVTDYYNTIPGEGDISEDPHFLDSSGHDFRLGTGSPCRDAGDPDARYDDLDGTRNDMGVFGGPGLDTTFFATRGATLRIGGVIDQSHDTIGIPIIGSFVRGTASAEITIGYDPLRLHFTGVQTTSGTAMFSLRQSEPTPATIGLQLISPRGLSDDSVVVAILHFVPTSRKLSTTLRFRDATLLKETTSEIPISELVDGTIVLTSVGEDGGLPAAYELEQNYPNPFNPSTTLRYRLPFRSSVALRVYDVLGRDIVTLVDEIQDAGSRAIEWNSLNRHGLPVSSGVYIYRFEASPASGDGRPFTRVRKMILIR